MWMPCTLFLLLLVTFLACAQVSQNQLHSISTAPTWISMTLWHPSCVIWAPCPVPISGCLVLGNPVKFRSNLSSTLAAKLVGWKGKLMTKAGCLALINSVLTSITTYFMTIFQPSKWGFKRFDKIGRSFLWSGDEEARELNLLLPKQFGGY